MSLNIIVLIILTVVVSITVLYLIIRLWPRTGKMGINVEKVNCPLCGEKAPIVRAPKNMKQFLWGGWTCVKCGCEMDKYGIQINS